MDNPNSSSTMDIYYKGFHVSLTNRGYGNPIEKLWLEQKAFIDAHSNEEGFRPSWNLQTAKEVAKEDDPTEKWGANGKADPLTCLHQNKIQKTSHTEKNMGRVFESCTNCGKFISWAHTPGFAQ